MIKSPYNLKCEYLVNPIGIDTISPRFSWLLDHEERNQKQSAYQILVASNKEHLKSNKGDLWDSGKTDSALHFNIIYEGASLNSDRFYYWTVKWWDKHGTESGFSPIASFSTALMEKSDWKANWISRSEFTDKDTLKKCQYKSGDRGLTGRIKEVHAVYLRKEFQISKPIQTAKAYVCGIGYYEFHLNGEKVGNKILDPAQTDYHELALYSTFDITDKIEDNNAIGIILGNGRCIELFKYDYPKLILQINLHYEDGSSENVLTDESWKVSSGPIQENGMYFGEIYDARLEITGWNQPNFDDSSWNAAVCVQGHNLASQMMEPIQITKILKPQTISSPKPGMYVYDFEQNFTGFCRLKARGPKGTRIQLRFSELLYEDGTLNTATNGNAGVTDVYILKGDGEEIFEPHFTYHGFRYVEMTGFPGVPSLNNLEGLFFHSNVSNTGNFSCSNDLINKIHTNVIWGQLSNLMSIPTDCPQRDERHGWMGDEQLTVEEAIYNFDMARFYIKYLRDIKVCQKEDGSISDVVPPYWKLYPADPAWGTAYITTAWYLYYHYNDIHILEEHYDSMKCYVDFLSSIAKDDLVLMGKFGDWCPPCSIVSRRTPVELTSAWYYYHDTLLLSKIAYIIGKDKEAESYLAKSEIIKKAFNKKFLRGIYTVEKLSPADGTVSQTSNVLPLYLNMVPEKSHKRVLNALIECIQNEFDYHFNTGIVGTRYIFDVLTENGYPDIIYKMVKQESFPGYGYMIKEGATTLWERWENLKGAGMNSHNHIMLGSVDPWFYKCLAGINAIEPGWKSLRIKPYIPFDMDYVTASVNTIRGRVHVSWEKTVDLLRFVTQIPIGSSAELWLPKYESTSIILEGDMIIWEKGKSTMDNSVITLKEEKVEYLIFELGSGFYEFKIN
ncbi:MAG: glycoside hydrolase family 78 protein [Candidatus Lokiarchaeota archaeon]|nr:glycoside hydrolase family 78 protein [Candidatus Lokiarchaeota archaeon]